MTLSLGWSHQLPWKPAQQNYILINSDRTALGGGLLLFLKNGPIPASFCFYRLFYMSQFKYNLIKVSMVCLGFVPRAAG